MEGLSYIGPDFGPLQVLLFILCGGGWGVSMGVQIGLGIVMNEIHSEWHASYSETSVVAVSTMLGEFIGAYFWGVISDRYGRMAAFKKSMFLISASCVASAFATDVWILSLCFLLAGFGIGGSFTVDGTVFLEYICIDKAYLLTGISALMALGGSIAPAIAWIYNTVEIGNMWRHLQLTLAGLAIIVGIPRLFIKETPQYLHCKENGSVVLAAFRMSSRFSALGYEDNRSLIVPEVRDPKTKSTKQQMLALFRLPLRMYTICFMVIWWCSAFAISSINIYIPALMDRVGVGLDPAEIYQNMFYQQIAGVPGVIFATYLVNSCCGRKWTFVFSVSVAGVLIFGFLIANYIFVISK